MTVWTQSLVLCPVVCLGFPVIIGVLLRSDSIVLAGPGSVVSCQQKQIICTQKTVAVIVLRSERPSNKKKISSKSKAKTSITTRHFIVSDCRQTNTKYTVTPVPAEPLTPVTADWVRIRTFRRKWSELRWSQPHRVTARTSHCVQLQGKGDTWFHLTSCVACDPPSRSLADTGLDLRTQVQEREDTESDGKTDTEIATGQHQQLQIIHKIGDIFTSPHTEPLAHCVSADCAYGAGIAKQFKRRYGTGKVIDQNKQPGECAVTKEEDGRIIFHLITKEQCTDLPTYDCFTESLKHMRGWCVANRVKRVSVPRLGCGLDKLDFKKVQKILSEVFTDVDIQITIYSL
ncbi:uncharacterized protein LOC130560289 [Triplophysa rosa]|uniref:uncharacterized protein LOC130560289 n=1 Tax=Triplophysa rosa TaxID=992332 RepID=UPI0025460CBC|nr:uncharacterized protein LOC130560289 [Triplophysa rosa]